MPNGKSEITDDLFDEILSVQAQQKVTGCTVGEILAALPDAQRESLDRALQDPRINGTIIAKVLKDKGHPLSSHTVQRHRRGGCSCA